VTAHEAKRQLILSQAIAEGKFPAERSGHWAAQFDKDPKGTERTIAMLASPAPPGGIPLAPAFRETYSDFGTRGGAQPALASSPPEGNRGGRYEDLTPEVVATWSRGLFPEIGRAAARSPRITRSYD
jgi:hypothetical protein